jgi:hypothetical protein
MVAQDRPGEATLRVGGSRRAPSRTAAGTVCAAASPTANPTRPSDAQPTQRGSSAHTIWTTMAASVASITAAMSRFIGLAAVVTRR